MLLPISFRSHHRDEMMKRCFVIVEDENVFSSINQLLHDEILASPAKIYLFLFRQLFLEYVVAGMENKYVVLSEKS
jgi:hypothetical protein